MQTLSNHQAVSLIQDQGEGDTVRIGGVSVTLKVTGRETGGRFAVFESTVPAHHAGPGLHRHRQTTETFYILQGMLAFTVDDETVVAGPGSLIVVAPGVLHRFWNPTAAPATYLAFLSPAGFEGYFVELAALAAETTWPPTDHQKLATLIAQYDLELHEPQG